jgi:hypothetical protein
LQKVLIRVWVVSVLTATATTEELLSRTSCELFSQVSWGSARTPFLF